MQVPFAADPRSVQGGLACHLPYVDAHLADVAPDEGREARWHYIHRTDLQYAQSFPLKGGVEWVRELESQQKMMKDMMKDGSDQRMDRKGKNT